MLFRKIKQRTFNSEDRRKDKLFIYWNAFLAEGEERGLPNLGGATELLVSIAEISGNQIKLIGEDEIATYSIHVTDEIAKYSAIDDVVNLQLVPEGERWRPIEIISVSSLVTGHSRKNGIHFSYNPVLHIECPHCGGANSIC